jgi:hypothetical protein
MIRRFKYFKKTFLFALALTLTNCQVDETPIEQQNRIETVTINEAKTLLIRPSTTKSSTFSKEELSNLEFDKISQEKINGSDQLLTIIPYSTNDKTKNERILLLKIDKEIKSVVFSMYPEENSQKDHFSGKIFTYSLDGDFINGLRAKNGIIVSLFVKNTNGKNSENLKSMHQRAVQLNEVIIQNNYHKTVDALDVFGSSSIFGSGLFDDGFGNYGGGDTSYSWDPGAESTGRAITQIIEEKIDNTQLDPCPKEVMEKLKNTTNADIASVLAKLGANSLYTVNIVMKPATTYAEAQKISKYNYEIRVDQDRHTDGTKLFKATALIHEVIHAYFLSILDDYNTTPSTALPSFPELFEVYVKKAHPTSTDKQDAQHLAMANKYVDAMASALQEYDANYLIDYQVYKDLAWGGLSGTPIFNETYPLGSAENTRILNRYRAESSGHAVEQGTSNQQTPVGKPCN